MNSDRNRKLYDLCKKLTESLKHEIISYFNIALENKTTYNTSGINRTHAYQNAHNYSPNHNPYNRTGGYKYLNNYKIAKIIILFACCLAKVIYPYF